MTDRVKKELERLERRVEWREFVDLNAKFLLHRHHYGSHELICYKVVVDGKCRTCGKEAP